MEGQGDRGERGVSLRELRAGALRQDGETATIAAGVEAATPTRDEPPRQDLIVSAAIVARARAAMRQANEPPTEHPGQRTETELSGEVVTAEAETSVGRLEGRDTLANPDAIHASVCAASESSMPLIRAPWEMPEQHCEEPAACLAADDDEQPTKPWSGYNPDYVADQLVPIIHARATTGWRSWLGLRPSKAEHLHQELRAAMCVNFGQPVKIVLANPRGYAGKTTLTVLLAGALGLARGGGVCAFENHELRGVMALRTVTNDTQHTTRDFINDLSTMAPDQVRHGDLARYVRHQHTGNFDAMVTSRNAEKQLTGDEYRRASALLARFYQVTVIDTANNEAHEAFRAAMEEATVLVVPTKWRPTHITPATQMLNDMAEMSARHKLLVQNAVVVASNGAGEVVPGTREMAMPMFSSLAHTVIEVPPDPHIEADRPILHHQLRPATRSAVNHLGAAVCGAAVKNLRGMEKL